MPDGTPGLPEPVNVLLLNTEDDPEDTIRPRLDAADTDVSRVLDLRSVGTGRDERLPALPTDLPVIRQFIEKHAIKYVVIDPLMAYLGEKVNSFKDQDVRRALAPLAQIAQDTGATIHVVRHLNKGDGGNALYRGGGSIGIIGAARCGWILATDPTDDTGERRVLAVSKANLGAVPRSLACHTEQTDADVSRIVWDGPSPLTANQLVQPRDKVGGNAPRQEAADFLADLLKDGPMSADDIEAEAKRAGISWMTVKRARQDLGIKPRKEGFAKDGRWVWAWPVTHTCTREERRV